MATGKNKTLQYARLYFGGVDLSGDSRKFDRLENSVEPVDTTGLSDTVTNFLGDRRKMGVMGYQAFMNDTTTTGASNVIATPTVAHVMSVFMGGGAAPAAGDLAYILPAVQLGDVAEFSSKIGLFTTDLLPNAATVTTNLRNPFGVVLYPLTSTAATTNGSTVNNGAATTLGGHAILHVTATSVGDYAILIQQSTTGAWAGEETTLLTFASTGAPVGGEWQSISGNVAQYLRARLVKTAGTISAAIAFARN